MTTTQSANDICQFYTEDGILYGTYDKKGAISIEDAHQLISLRLSLIGEKEYPTLIRVRKGTSFAKEARDFLSSDEGVKGVKAAAIIADNAIVAAMANFFLKVTVRNPKVPTKIFRDEKAAQAWLSQYK